MTNGELTPELAERILNEILIKIDDGNETIMTDSFTKFIQAFPEYSKIVEKIYIREIGRSFRVYEERVSKRGY